MCRGDDDDVFPNRKSRLHESATTLVETMGHGCISCPSAKVSNVVGQIISLEFLRYHFIRGGTLRAFRKAAASRAAELFWIPVFDDCPRIGGTILRWLSVEL